jgi:LemA protein
MARGKAKLETSLGGDALDLRIIRERNACEAAWSGIDVQLKGRHDLVPGLVETVKGYASHEKEVFDKVVEARASAMAARGTGQTVQAEQQLTAALVDLRAVAENYPRLRATENFQQPSGELTQIEGQIQAARDAYNSDVQAYNTKIQVFPNSIIARQGGFGRASSSRSTPRRSASRFPSASATRSIGRERFLAGQGV